MSDCKTILLKKINNSYKKDHKWINSHTHNKSYLKKFTIVGLDKRKKDKSSMSVIVR